MMLWMLACAPQGPLLDPHGWEAQASDPWGTGEVCSGWAVEEEQIEVRTEDCAWISLTQGLSREVPAGTEVRGGVLWDGLYADEPAEAVLGLAVAGEVVWEATVPIPSGSDDAPLHVRSTGWMAGDEVVIHVHNHGLNSYTWLPLRDAE